MEGANVEEGHARQGNEAATPVSLPNDGAKRRSGRLCARRADSDRTRSSLSEASNRSGNSTSPSPRKKPRKRPEASPKNKSVLSAISENHKCLLALFKGSRQKLEIVNEDGAKEEVSRFNQYWKSSKHSTEVCTHKFQSSKDASGKETDTIHKK